MKALMVVGKSLIDEAIRISEVANSRYISTRLVANRVNTDNADSRTNTAVDFKLIVKNKKGKIIDFTHVFKGGDAWFDQIVWLPEEEAAIAKPSAECA
jgi:hypothetical protein